jgi:hypothetical protein
VAITVHVTYRHENGVPYAGSVVVAPRARASITIPSWVPDGAVGATLTSSSPFVAERAMYGGTGWELGHAGVASPVAATTWRFAEGATGAFDTYFLLTNPSGKSTTATLTFRTTAGTTVTTAVWVPADGRASVYANGVAGLKDVSFQTTVTAGQPIVVERATYWWSTSGLAARLAGEDTLGSEADGGSAAGTAALPLAAAPRSGAPAAVRVPVPYSLGEVAPVDAIGYARAEGRVSEEERALLEAVATARAAFLATGPPGAVSGLAPPRWGTTEAAPASTTEGVTPAAAALPWIGGHVTLGRIP